MIVEKTTNVLSVFSATSRRLGPFLELGIVSVLFLATFALVVSNRNPYEKNWAHDTFYQRYYATAVMAACDRGWFSTDTSQIPELNDFLALRSDSFSCDDLPADLKLLRPNYQANRHHYLFRSVELTWRLRGKISWQGLKPLLGLFCAAVTAAVYGIFRLGMGRVVAVAGTLAFLPHHLIQLPQFRDYSKAPFFLIALFCLGLMVKGPLGRRRLIWLSAAAGFCVGIGLGFRSDILIAIPAVVVTISFFVPGGWRCNLRLKLVALLVFLATFFVAATPVLRLERSAHATSHVVLLGLTNRFTEALGLSGTLYEWSHIYSDPWPAFQIKSLAFFGKGIDETVPMYSAEYDRLGVELLAHVVRNYPADIVARAYGSIIQIIKLPLVFYLLVLVISVFSRRRAIFLFVAVLYFAGYLGTQFQPRHTFHLQFLPFWLAGVGLTGAFRLAMRGLETAYTSGTAALRAQVVEKWRLAVRSLILHAVISTSLILVPLWGLRIYQSSRVAGLLESYENARLVELPTEGVHLGDGLVRIEPKDLLVPLPSLESQELMVGYLVAEPSGESCQDRKVNLTLRYEPGAYHDFSRTLELDLSNDGGTKVFAPVYSREKWNAARESAFLGIEVSSDTVSCLRLSRIADFNQFLPILYVELPGCWRERSIYQTFDDVGGWNAFRKLLMESENRWRRIGSSLVRSYPKRPPRRLEPGPPPGAPGRLRVRRH
ncbi:MAG: hypothetical protein GY906_35960 [bacterium]|nr:hypothetical protein [bacterium]